MQRDRSLLLGELRVLSVISDIRKIYSSVFSQCLWPDSFLSGTFILQCFAFAESQREKKKRKEIAKAGNCTISDIL